MTPSRENPEKTACPGEVRVPTERECAVLARIRETAAEARELSGRIAALEAQGNAAALAEARARLEALRHLRAELEVERLAAARERMRLLGHLD